MNKIRKWLIKHLTFPLGDKHFGRKLIYGLFALQLLDIATTMFFISMGLKEANPLMAVFFNSNHFMFLLGMLLKLSVSSLIIFILMPKIINSYLILEERGEIGRSTLFYTMVFAMWSICFLIPINNAVGIGLARLGYLNI